MAMSKAQIDRLGDRLRSGISNEEDLRLLDEYRRSFTDAYRAVSRVLSDLGLEHTSRGHKTTQSIVRKLRRESSRLSQIQDLAGCRIVVPDIVAQEEEFDAIRQVFPDAHAVDRRDKPNHGYRAIHVVHRIDGKPIEIQLRSDLQHVWAGLSEMFSDEVDPEIKYGGGPASIRLMFNKASEVIAGIENDELRLAEARHLPQSEATLKGIARLDDAVSCSRHHVVECLVEMVEMLIEYRKSTGRGQ